MPVQLGGHESRLIFSLIFSVDPLVWEGYSRVLMKRNALIVALVVVRTASPDRALMGLLGLAGGTVGAASV